MYKLVDEFNGYAASRHKTLKAAVISLDKWRRRFNKINPGADFMGTIVPDNSEYVWINGNRQWQPKLSNEEIEEIYLIETELYG